MGRRSKISKLRSEAMKARWRRRREENLLALTPLKGALPKNRVAVVSLTTASPLTLLSRISQRTIVIVPVKEQSGSITPTSPFRDGPPVSPRTLSQQRRAHISRSITPTSYSKSESVASSMDSSSVDIPQPYIRSLAQELQDLSAGHSSHRKAQPRTSRRTLERAPPLDQTIPEQSKTKAQFQLQRS